MADWSNSKQVGNWGSRMIVEVDLNSQSQSGNTSSITVRIRLQNGGTSTARNNDGVSWSMSNGVSASGSNSFSIGAGSTGTLVSRNFTISHNSNGTKSLTVTAKVNNTGTSTFGTPGSVSVSVTLPRIPKPPNAPATPTTSGVTQTSATINWTAPGNNGASITQYQIRFYRETGNAWQDHTQTGRSRTYSGLTANTTYRARVRARNSAGWGPWSGYRTFKTSPGVPSKPGRPTVSGATSNSFRANLSAAPAANGASITEYQWEAGSNFYNFTSGGRSVTIPNRNPNAQHRTRVRARNSAGWSSWSDWSAYINTLPNAPAAPSGITVTRVSDTHQTISWTRNATTAAPYDSQRVLRRHYSGTEWTAFEVVNPVSGTATSFSDQTTRANGQYQYRIQAINSAGTSTSATSSSIRTTPAAPTSVTGKKVGDHINVSYQVSTPYLDQISHEIQDNPGGAGWVTIGTITGTSPFVHQNPDPSVTHQYRARTLSTLSSPSLNSAWSTPSAVVQLLAPPLAPTLIAPVGTLDRDKKIKYRWRHNSVDTTDQAAVQVRVWKSDDPDNPYSSFNNYTSEEELEDLIAYGQSLTLEWSARTKGDHPDFGPWAPRQVFKIASQPSVFIQEPDPGTLDRSQVEISWGYSNADGAVQNQWQAELLDEYHATLQTATGTGNTSRHLFPYILSDETEYTVRVRSRASSGIWSEWDSVTFVTDFPLPYAMEVLPDWDPETASATLTFQIDPGAEIYPALHYEWEGEPDDSASLKYEYGIVTSRNEFPDPKFVNDPWSKGQGETSGVSVERRSDGSLEITVTEELGGRWHLWLDIGGYEGIGTAGLSIWADDFSDEVVEVGVGGPRTLVSPHPYIDDVVTSADFQSHSARVFTLSGEDAPQGYKFYVARPFITPDGYEPEYFDGDFIGDTSVELPPERAAVESIDVQRNDNGEWVTLGRDLDPETSLVDYLPRLIKDVKYRVISRTTLPTARMGREFILDASFDCDQIFVNGGADFSLVATALGNSTSRRPEIESAAHRWAGWEFPQAVFGTGEEYSLDFEAPLINTSRGKESTQEEGWLRLLRTRRVVCFRDSLGKKFYGILSVNFSREEMIDTLSLSMQRTHYIEGLEIAEIPGEEEEDL